MEVGDLAARYPVLYHMAEKDTWPSIREHGLLSTTAILDRFNVNGVQRIALEDRHRPEKITVGPRGSLFVLRDQKPMAPDRLASAFTDGTTPSQWYHFLNSKVFMWAQEHRLLGLLNARAYRALEHDVLTINTRTLLAQHADRIWLCRMNSGNTYPVPHPRAMTDFKRIADYPTRNDGVTPAPEVVEVVADYNIPDILQHVVQVRRMHGATVIRDLPL